MLTCFALRRDAHHSRGGAGHRGRAHGQREQSLEERAPRTVACSTRSIMRMLSISETFSLARRPRRRGAIGDAERGLVLAPGAASKRRATSSGLTTTGSLRGSWTNVRCRAASARPSVTVKKNRNAETVELIIAAPARFSVKCNWKRRRSSLVAVSGDRPR